MTTLINQIKAVFTSGKSTQLDCNYADNYYGDQYCQQKWPNNHPIINQ